MNRRGSNRVARGNSNIGRGRPNTAHVQSSHAPQGRNRDNPPQNCPTTTLEVRLVTNFFRIQTTQQSVAHCYDCQIDPDPGVGNNSLIEQIIEMKKREISQIIGRFYVSGLKVIALKRMEQQSLTYSQITIRDIDYSLTIRHCRAIDQAEADQYREISFIYNIALKRALRNLNLRQLNSQPKYFNSNRTISIDEHNISVWQGYMATFAYCNIGMQNEGFFLNIDFASKIVHNLNVCQYIYTQRDRGISTERIADELFGRTIMACYGGRKCYMVKSIRFDLTPLDDADIPDMEGNFIGYYREKYGIEINETRQPLIECEIKLKGEYNTIYMVPELCCLTGLDDFQRQDYRVMNSIGRVTQLAPGKRLEVAEELAKDLSSRQNRSFDQFGLQLDPTPIQLNALQYPMPTIIFNTKDTQRLDYRAQFQMRYPVFKGKDLTTWSVLCEKRDHQDFDAGNMLIQAMMKHSRDYQISVGRPDLILFENRQDFERKLQDFASRNMQIIVVIYSKDSSLYDKGKSITVSQNFKGATQFIKGRSLKGKRAHSILQNVFLQIAAKTGSVLWRIQRPEGIPAKTMVVGMDVYHSTKDRQRSLVAYTASVDQHFSKYFNMVQFQDVGEELISNSQRFFREALLSFFRETREKFYPDLIIVFRDGVGEGMTKLINEFEVEGLKAAIDSLNNCQPDVYWYSVNKKTNVKLGGRLQNGRVENPKPGSIVVDGIVPTIDDFYLISHAVTNGMASPTLYRLMYKSFRTAEISKLVIGEFAFRLCYAYPNWQGGIKIPAPTMFAHKLAYLVGKSSKSQNYSSPLHLSLFYL